MRSHTKLHEAATELQVRLLREGRDCGKLGVFAVTRAELTYHRLDPALPFFGFRLFVI